MKSQPFSAVRRRFPKPDRFLTRRIFAIPIFVCVMLLIFYLTFGPVGSFPRDALSLCIGEASARLSGLLSSAGVNPAFYALVTQGVCAGVGSVLSFLPVIAILFFCLSLLEECGYLSRIAVIMDPFTRKIGLSGAAIVPLILGFGCSVPAILAASALPSRQDRRLASALIPFMSCSAKLPVYAMFTAVFFPSHPVLVMACLYFTGILTGILLGAVLKHTLCREAPAPLPFRLPPYHLPSLRKVLSRTWDNMKGFALKAFTVIFAASVMIWYLQSFDIHFHMIDNSENSILALIGKRAAPLFAPLGFGDWRAAAALITGISAKEAIVSTLAVLTPGMALTEIFTPLSAFSFLVFCLLYTPCVAALTAAGRQAGSWKHALRTALLQCAVAWIVSFIIYQTGGLLYELLYC
ncbi:ferrous iron transporter B [bacterium 210820-DFI.6.37]|nr:ferrous iron transporter B [bacterium 210820-DFI.6.37]